MADGIKVFELAKDLDLKALELIEKVKSMSLGIKNHMSDLTGEQVEQIRVFLNPPALTEEPKKKTVRVSKAKQAEAAEKAANLPRKSIMVKRAKAAEEEVPEAEELAPEPTSNEVSQESQSTAEAAETSEEIATPTEAKAPEAEPVVEAAKETSAGDLPSTPAAPVEAAVEAPVVRRGPRYSIIRVVSAEPQTAKKNLIVEDAPAGGMANYTRGKSSTSVPKTFSDPVLSKTGTGLLRETEAAEELRRRRGASTPRIREEDQMFKSTDFLRRERVYQHKKKRISIGRTANAKNQSATASAHKRVVDFDSGIAVSDLAHQMAVKVSELLKKLKTLGVEQPEEIEDIGEWRLEIETAQLVSQEFGFEIRDETFKEEDILEAANTEDANKKPRSPVITIMGHVDHGKTSLLDIIRRARVASGEAGGITQHIGAYTVSVADAVKNLSVPPTADAKKDKADKKTKKDTSKSVSAKGKPAAKVERLTFLDTPGHAAFTSMRSRGAKITDIVVLVVSAVDGVMPQTREAVEHAKAASVPIIVAVNKIDMPDSNPDRIKKQLGDLGLIPEEWGGETIFVEVSAKVGTGVDKLLEMIQLQAEILELKAVPDGPGEGAVIEAKLDKGRGPLASVLVKNGTLKITDYVVAGTQYGRVRALIDDKGAMVKEAGPSTPVEILGLSGVPEAGDAVNVVSDEKAARTLSDHRAEIKRQEGMSKPLTLEDIHIRMAQGDFKELNLILKADVKGSAEAISAALLKLPMDKVKIKLLSTGVGGISENDVLLASTSGAIILGFNVRPDGKTQSEAERRGVQIKAYSIIYNLIDEVTMAMEGLLDPTLKETVVGRAEVRDVFNLTKSGIVAGCSVTKGKVQRNNSIRLIRDGRVVFTGKLSGLRRFKDEAKEVAEGFECGISIESYTDIKAGDVIEAFSIESVASKLNEGSASHA